MPISPFVYITVDDSLDVGKNKLNDHISLLVTSFNTLESRTINTTNSLIGGGDLTSSRTLQLAGDVSAPGANKVYGTDSGGNKTWKSDPVPALPPEYSNSTPSLTPAAGGTTNFSLPLTHNRLYGISVSISGLTTGQTATVRLFGDMARTEEQYIANFTDTMIEDNAQAWRYRSRVENFTLYGSVENTSASALSVSITIVAEPF